MNHHHLCFSNLLQITSLPSFLFIAQFNASWLDSTCFPLFPSHITPPTHFSFACYIRSHAHRQPPFHQPCSSRYLRFFYHWSPALDWLLSQICKRALSRRPSSHTILCPCTRLFSFSPRPTFFDPPFLSNLAHSSLLQPRCRISYVFCYTRHFAISYFSKLHASALVAYLFWNFVILQPTRNQLSS